MIKLARITIALVWCAIFNFSHAQYGSSYSAPAAPSSYGAYPSPSSGYAASPAMQSASASVYPSVNLPLLSFPAFLGNATINVATGTAAVATAVAGTTSVVAGGTNYLATLPAAPLANVAPYNYAFGVYANDFDASRDSYYNHSDVYAFNQYTTNMTGFGALNLSNPQAVGAANWWSPYPYQLAAWNDGYTTQASVSTTAAPTVVGAAAIVNASVYYAAYGGNLNGLGVPGLGLSVPGLAPNVSAILPGLNYAYNTGAAATSAPAASYGSSGYASAPAASYGSPSAPSSGSSYGTGYGRR